uniref:Uncharacterized protein n=1 Tax=Ascaris lumbricoides TaxID=6252 RepID=A0A0M3HFJ2_ASCLU
MTRLFLIEINNSLYIYIYRRTQVTSKYPLDVRLQHKVIEVKIFDRIRKSIWALYVS